jgi:hypothetical protein
MQVSPTFKVGTQMWLHGKGMQLCASVCRGPKTLYSVGFVKKLRIRLQRSSDKVQQAQLVVLYSTVFTLACNRTGQSSNLGSATPVGFSH